MSRYTPFSVLMFSPAIVAIVAAPAHAQILPAQIKAATVLVTEALEKYPKADPVPVPATSTAKYPPTAAAADKALLAEIAKLTDKAAVADVSKLLAEAGEFKARLTARAALITALKALKTLQGQAAYNDSSLAADRPAADKAQRDADAQLTDAATPFAEFLGNDAKGGAASKAILVILATRKAEANLGKRFGTLKEDPEDSDPVQRAQR